MAIQVNYKHKQATPDLQRRREGETVLKKFPTKIPLAVGMAHGSDLQEINTTLFYPANATVGTLVKYLNKTLDRASNAALYIYVDGEIVLSQSSRLSKIYQEYREDDFFLYVAYYEVNIYQKNRHSRASTVTDSS